MPSSPDFQSTYLALIDDTLTYLHALLPPDSPIASQPIAILKRTPPVVSKKNQVAAAPPLAEPPATSYRPNREPARQPKSEPKPTHAFFSLSPPQSPPETSFTALRALIKDLFPKLSLSSAVPDDGHAKRVRDGWQTKQNAPTVAILLQGQTFRPFFTHLAKAITLCLAPAKVITAQTLERANQWDLFLAAPQLRLVIAPDATLFAAKKLLPHYKEIPQEKRRFLGHVPLLLLPDPSLYLKDPLLKRSLWHLIQKALR
ncbi:MAG: hypothetical protein AAF443_03545 [Chlamydiota bacterium]